MFKSSLLFIIFLLLNSFVYSVEIDVLDKTYIRSNEIDRVLLMGKDPLSGEAVSLRVNKTTGALEVNATVTATAEVTVDGDLKSRTAQTGGDEYYILGSSVEGTIRSEIYSEDSSTGSIFRSKGDSATGSILVKQVEAITSKIQIKDSSSGDFYDPLGNSVEGTFRSEMYAKDTSTGDLFILEGDKTLGTLNISTVLTAKLTPESANFNVLGSSTEGTLRVEIYAEDESSGSLFRVQGKDDKLSVNTLLTAKNSAGDEFTLIGNSIEGNLRVQIYGQDHTTGNLFPLVGSEKDGCLWTNCYKNEVVLGNVPYIESNYKFGFGTVAGAYEAVWDYAGSHTRYNYITESYPTGTTLAVSSSSVEDNPAGTGAFSIKIFGLDTDYNPLSEEVTLNGQTIVSTTGQFIRMYRAYVMESGTTGTNAGNIFIHKSAVTSGSPTTANLVYGMISAGQGQTLMSVLTVPAGKKMLVTAYSIGSGDAKKIYAGAFVREFGTNTWRNRLASVSYQERKEQLFEYPLVIPAKSDIEIRAYSSVSTADIDATWYYLLVDE